MTKDEIMESISLKKRFCKDYNIPIAVYDNPYFMQRLTIIDKVKPCLANFIDFCKELEKFDNEQDYFEYYNSVKDKTIDFLKGNECFIDFNTRKIEMPEFYISKRNLYIEDNDENIFISLDMKKANFSALRFYNAEIFDGATTWEEFLSKFTDSRHVINSKYIRQVIMGACNPKRQIQQEKLIMFSLMNTVITQLTTAQSDGSKSDIEAALEPLRDFEVYSLGEDEIILHIIGNGTLRSYYQLISDIVKKTEYSDFIRVTAFMLSKIKGTDGYIKRILTDYDKWDIEFKCLSAEIYHQVVKYFLSIPVCEDDLVFYHNGKLAKYLEPIKNPWE